jgi:hypothetical protein
VDTALRIRIAFEEKNTLDKEVISQLLDSSILVNKLTKDFVDKPLFVVFRLMGLSEIPHIESLSYTKKIIDYANQNMATGQGFSCLGGVEEIVPCYNAMLFEAYCRLGLAQSKEAQDALNWIKQFQLFKRNQTTAWHHKGVCKHGGCLGKTPCYIGIGKTVRALITYSEFINHEDRETEKLIKEGTDYMLMHKMFQRLSSGQPISKHITDITFPQSYFLSLTDLIYIAGKRNLMNDENCSDLKVLLKDKELEENQWKIEYNYGYKGYVAFETRRKASDWISTLYPIWLSGS